MRGGECDGALLKLGFRRTEGVINRYVFFHSDSFTFFGSRNVQTN